MAASPCAHACTLPLSRGKPAPRREQELGEKHAGILGPPLRPSLGYDGRATGQCQEGRQWLAGDEGLHENGRDSG